MSEEIHPQELKGLEAALGALLPTPSRIDRDGLMFRAGRASVTRRRWAWPAATAVLASVAATLAIVLIARPRPEPEQVVIYVPVEKLAEPPATQIEPPSPPRNAVVLQETEEKGESPAQTSYFHLQQLVLRWGLDGLASPPVVSRVMPPLTMEELLGEIPKHREPAPWFELPDFLNKGGKS